MNDQPKNQTASGGKPNPMERRLVLRLLKYWREIGGDESFPALADIDKDAIPDMWSYCALLAVAGPNSDPIISYMGTAIGGDGGQDLTGKPLSAAAPDTLPGRAMSYYKQVLAKMVPITLGGEFTDARSRKVLYRSIVLPLADDGKTIDHLLCAANCRIVTQT
ncbi:MAG: PAS domain-containing protein [Alphaproteobacteria bacterium]